MTSAHLITCKLIKHRLSASSTHFLNHNHLNMQDAAKGLQERQGTEFVSAAPWSGESIGC